MQKKIEKVHGENVKIIDETYKGSNKKCDFIDKDYGIFSAYPHNVIAFKQRHPQHKSKKLPEEVCMKENTPRRSRVREIILEKKLIEYTCKECGQGDMWQNKKLVLQLHHINGNPTDNRLENFCFLCPNCHTQTETYFRGLKGVKNG